VRVRLVYQITYKSPVATDNLVNIAAAVQEDYMMSNATTSSRFDVIYRSAFGEAQINFNVAP
jgi:hypothetical protein